MKLSIQKALLPDAMPIARLLDEVTVQLHQNGICSGNTLGIRIKSDRTSCWNGCGHAGTAKSWSALFRCGRCRPPYGWTAGQSLTANGICIGWLCAPPARAAGLGTELIRFACCLADHAQKDLYLDCWAGNHALRRFYSFGKF